MPNMEPKSMVKSALLKTNTKTTMAMRKDRTVRVLEMQRILMAAHIERGLTPVGLKELLEHLGPTYVKLGQILSTRTDVLPEEYCLELKKLHAQVNPVPFDEIRTVLTQELGAQPEDIFAHIDQLPLGSASLAQVYKAVLKTGETVAVKVQRPGVAVVMKKDIEILRGLIHGFEIIAPTGSQIVNLEDVVNELDASFKEEVNLLLEGRNLADFARYNADVAYITCPTYYPCYSTGRVLTMSYIDGIPIDDKNRLEHQEYDLEEIGTKLIDNYVKQIMDDGFVHADPHPGNITIVGSQIVYMDFGMVGRMSATDRKNMKAMVRAIVDNDSVSLRDTVMVIAGQATSNKTDKQKLLSEIESLMSRYFSVSLADINVTGFIGELLKLLGANGLVVPSQYTMVARGLLTIEGLLEDLIPEFNIMKIIKNHFKSELDPREFIEDELKSLLVDSRRGLKSSLGAAGYSQEIMRMIATGELKMNMEVQGSQEPIHKIGLLVDRLGIAIIVAGLFIGSSIIVYADVPPIVLGWSLLGVMGYISAFICSLWIVWGIVRQNRQ